MNRSATSHLNCSHLTLHQRRWKRMKIGWTNPTGCQGTFLIECGQHVHKLFARVLYAYTDSGLSLPSPLGNITHTSYYRPWSIPELFNCPRHNDFLLYNFNCERHFFIK